MSIVRTDSDSGCIFINKEDAGTVTYTLPAVADSKGKWYWFYNAQTSAAIAITSGTASVFMGSDGATSSTMTTSTDAIGDSAIVICDGSYYYLIVLDGTWAES